MLGVIGETMITKTSKHKEIIDKLHETYKAKNADYGNSFAKLFDKFGLRSSQIRLHDKLYRFDTLIDSVNNVKDESIKDTLMDMANYCIMTVIEIEQKEEWERQK